jgi:ankyrin repeat protein
VKAEWQQALGGGDLDTLNRLLTAGADINAADQHGQTSLMIAAHDGQTAVVKFLVDGGADLNRTAKHNLSALMLAVLGGHLQIVGLLVAAGADIDRRGTGAPGFDGKTAKDLAVASGRSDVVSVLDRRQ